MAHTKTAKRKPPKRNGAAKATIRIKRAYDAPASDDGFCAS